MHFFTATYDVAGVQGCTSPFSAGDCMRVATNLLEMPRPRDNSGDRRKGPLLFRLVMRARVGDVINVIEVASVRGKRKKEEKRETHELEEVHITVVCSTIPRSFMKPK